MNPSLPSGQKPNQEQVSSQYQQQDDPAQRAPKPAAHDEPAVGSQQSISLDEMMKKLRENERQKDEAGEMVTRSDGSTARRVRRRKRRSEQKEKKETKEASKKSVIIKSAFLVGFFLFLLMAGLFTLVAFNSDRYEEKLESRLGEWVGADVDLITHKLLPGSIEANRVSLVWPEDSHVSELTINRIEGNINFTSLLGARLGGQAVGGRNGTLVLRSPETPGQVVKEIFPADYPFNFNRYFCNLLDVQFGDTGQLSLKGAETSLRHFSNEGFRALVSGGTFQLQGWPDFEISNALLRFSDDGVKLDPVRLSTITDSAYHTSSALTLKGTIPLKRGEKAQLNFALTDFPVDVITGNHMGSFFSGSIRETTEGVAFYTAGNDSLDSMVLPFKGDRFVLKRFPVVENLKKILFEDVEEELVFNSDIGGLFRWSSRGSSIENLEMSNKNIRLEGGLVISAAGKIRGKITLWISMGFINDKPRLKNHPAFSRRGGEGNGYAIIDVNLMGTTKLPDDDFGVTVGFQSMGNEQEKKARKSVEELWDSLDDE